MHSTKTTSTMPGRPAADGRAPETLRGNENYERWLESTAMTSESTFGPIAVSVCRKPHDDYVTEFPAGELMPAEADGMTQAEKKGLEAAMRAAMMKIYVTERATASVNGAKLFAAIRLTIDDSCNASIEAVALASAEDKREFDRRNPAWLLRTARQLFETLSPAGAKSLTAEDKLQLLVDFQTIKQDNNTPIDLHLKTFTRAIEALKAAGVTPPDEDLLAAQLLRGLNSHFDPLRTNLAAKLRNKEAYPTTLRDMFELARRWEPAVRPRATSADLTRGIHHVLVGPSPSAKASAKPVRAGADVPQALWDEFLRFRSSKPSPTRPPGGRNARFTCHNCGTLGHFATDCPHERVNTCHNCGKRGHHAKECPLDRRSRPPRTEPLSPPSPRTSETCSHCKNRGHVFATCQRRLEAADATATLIAALAAGDDPVGEDDPADLCACAYEVTSDATTEEADCVEEYAPDDDDVSAALRSAVSAEDDDSATYAVLAGEPGPAGWDWTTSTYVFGEDDPADLATVGPQTIDSAPLYTWDDLHLTADTSEETGVPDLYMHTAADAGIATTSALAAEPQTPPSESGPGAGVDGTEASGDDDDGTERCWWGDPREGVTAATAHDVAPQTSTTGSGSGAGVDGTSDTARDRKRKHNTAHFWEITEEEMRRFIRTFSAVNLMPYTRSTRPDCTDAVDLLLSREAAAFPSRTQQGCVEESSIPGAERARQSLRAGVYRTRAYRGAPPDWQSDTWAIG
jgi:hypothetical protein